MFGCAEGFIVSRVQNVHPPVVAGCFRRAPGPYLPTTIIENESGTMAPRPPRPPAAGVVVGPYSAEISRILLVLLSSVKVLAPGIVFKFCWTVKLLAL